MTTETSSSLLQKLSVLLQKIDSGTDSITDYDEIIERKDGRKSLFEFMKSVNVQNGKDPQNVSLLLPEINHHKLNYGDEAYKTMKSDIKQKMMSGSFDRLFTVMPMEVSEDKTKSDEYQVPLLNQGRQHKTDLTEVDGYAKFVDTKEASSVAILDGQHRTFAMAEIMAAESSSGWTHDITLTLIFVVPKELSMNTEEHEAFLRCLPGLSKKIAEEKEKSLNTTLIDALETVAKINSEDIVFLSDFLAKENDNKDQMWNISHRDYQYAEEKETKMLATVEFLYKTLTKSSIFLESFKSRWTGVPDSDYIREFWRTDVERNFLTSQSIKRYFTTEQKLTAHKMFTKILKRSEFVDKLEKDQNSIRVDYRAYCIAQTLEPVFFHTQYKQDMIGYLNVLRGSNLISTHRLMYIATLAYVTSSRIIEGWLNYDSFMEVKIENFHGLKKDEKQTKMSPRKPLLKKCFFNYIVKSLFQLYSNFEKVQSLDEFNKMDLINELEQIRKTDAITKFHENHPLNLSLELAALPSKYTENSKKEVEKRDDNQYILDLFAIRYMSYLTIVLMKNGTSNHTLQFQSALLRGTKIESFTIPGEMSIFDFEGKEKELTRVFDVFHHGPLDMFSDKDFGKEDVDIQKGKEDRAWMARRKIWYLEYMTSRYGNFITKETVENFKKINETSNIQFTKNQRFSKFSYDATAFIDGVLLYASRGLLESRERFWFYPLNICQFFRTLPPKKDDIDFFADIVPEGCIGDENQKKLEKALPLKKVNVEFADYIGRLADWICQREPKQKKPDNPSSTQNEEEDDEEEEKISWDYLHKYYLAKYQKSKHKKKLVSNLINIVISGFVKKKDKPNLKGTGKKKSWSIEGDFATSSEIIFSDQVQENIKKHVKEFSNANSAFFSGQEVDIEIDNDKTEENQKKQKASKKENKMSKQKSDPNDSNLPKKQSEKNKDPSQTKYDPNDPGFQMMMMSFLQNVNRFANSPEKNANADFMNNSPSPLKSVQSEDVIEHPIIYNKRQLEQQGITVPEPKKPRKAKKKKVDSDSERDSDKSNESSKKNNGDEDYSSGTFNSSESGSGED